MKVLFLTIGFRKTPSTRFRVKQYLDALSKDGFEVSHIPVPHVFWKRVMILQHLYRSDVVVIQKKLFSSYELSIMRTINPKIIYDFDDNVMVEHPMHKTDARLERKLLKNKKRFIATLRSVRCVIAGNTYLKGLAEPYNPVITVIPTPIDVQKYVPGKLKRRREVVIGWIGTRSNLFYLKEIEQVLKQVTSEYANVRFKVVCDKEFKAEGMDTIYKPWNPETEVSDLQDFDIGIMPLKDDTWSQGKCGFKLLQYMAVGIPVVASPIGVNNDIITHGVNGFLAKTPDEWLECLSNIVNDGDLRHRLGIAGRKTVEEHYSVQACLKSLEDVLIGVHRGSP